jgi:transposase InsO family protein
VEDEARSGLDRHSDPGVRYTALSFSARLKEAGITPSMRMDRALGDATVESFVSTLEKAELVNRLEFPSRQAARTAISSVPGDVRQHPRAALGAGHGSPADFEEDRIG